MSTELRTCRVRTTDPAGAAFAEELVSLTPYEAGAQVPSGDPMPADDPQVAPELRALALDRVTAALRPEYERLVVGPPPSGLDCVFDERRPLVEADVTLLAETMVRHDGRSFLVRGRSQVVRRYYDGILDEIRIRK